MIGKLTGELTKWTLFDHKRQYGTMQNIPFYEAREFLMAVPYNGRTGQGQQRDIVESHARKLKKEMEAGTFTPANLSAGCSKKHGEAVVRNNDGTFTLPVNSDDPLLLTDGGHRFEAMALIVKELEEKVARAANGKDKERLTGWLEQAKALPVTVTIYFDGEPAQDFVRLQQGRAVDATHMLGIRIQHQMLEQPALRLSFDAAKVLHTQDGSPFQNSVRFDSRGKLPLPFSTLCSAGSSDIGTSLVGLARVGLSDKGSPKDAAWLANVVVSAFKSLRTAAPAALEYGRVLTTLSNNGTKGSVTMMVGVGVCLAYRIIALGHESPTEDDLSRLVSAVKYALNETVDGNFSSPVKRKLLGIFAKKFFSDMPGDKHDDLPVALLRTLSASAFGVGPLPKEKKEPKPAKSGRKKKDPVPAPTPAPAPAEVVVTNEPVVVTPPAEPVVLDGKPVDVTPNVEVIPMPTVEQNPADGTVVVPPPWNGNWTAQVTVPRDTELQG
jgi:hypothetical protein